MLILGQETVYFDHWPNVNETQNVSMQEFHLFGFEMWNAIGFDASVLFQLFNNVLLPLLFSVPMPIRLFY